MITFAQQAALDGVSLYPKQVEVLEAVSMGWPTSFVACNGAGKTAVVARAAVRGFFKRHPKGKLVATIWLVQPATEPALARYRHRHA